MKALGKRQREAMVSIGQSENTVFSQHIEISAYRTDHIRQSVMDSLCRIGLIQSHEYIYQMYRLTDSGRDYLAQIQSKEQAQ